MRKRASKQSAVSDDILALARSLEGIFNQSYAVVKPIVDDVCKHPESVGQDELEHLFDAVLDIMNVRGKRLFDRLCKAFGSIYPECVSDYIRIGRECYGE